MTKHAFPCFLLACFFWGSLSEFIWHTSLDVEECGLAEYCAYMPAAFDLWHTFSFCWFYHQHYHARLTMPIISIHRHNCRLLKYKLTAVSTRDTW